MLETKICNGYFCDGKALELSEFGVNKGEPRYECKECRNYRDRKRRTDPKVREKERIRGKKYNAENKEKEARRHKKYNAENKEKISRKRKIYQESNREKIHIRNQNKLQTTDGYLKYLIVQLRAKDKKQKRKCDIDFDYINELIDEQNNKCKYSNAKLIWSNRAGINQGTIDRIDSSLGHIKGNCQLVTVPINHFKTNLSVKNFDKIIKMIKGTFYKKIFDNNKIIPIKELTQKEKSKISTMFKDIRNREIERLQKNAIKDLLNNNIDENDVKTEVKSLITKENTEIEIDKTFLDSLRKKQNDRCALTGVKLSWIPNSLNVASLDRIDSSKGYTKDNVQITMWYVNCMKKDLPDSVAKGIIKNIVKNYSIN